MIPQQKETKRKFIRKIICLLKRNDNFTSLLLNPKQSASVKVWHVHYHYSSDPNFILSQYVKKRPL